MAAVRLRGPAPDVEDALHPGPRRQDQLAREQRQAEGRRYALAGRELERVEAVLLVEPQRRRRPVGEPVERDVGQQGVERDRAFDVAAAIAPGAEFLGDPGRESGGRIGQPDGERLRFGRLERRIGALRGAVRKSRDGLSS